MIRSFRKRETERLVNDRSVPRYCSFERVARRKLLMLHAAMRLEDLAVPPGTRLEALRSNRAGQHSIRINGRWRICFVWREGHAFDVEIADYH